MKIDRSRLKKSTSEVPADCQNLIEKLRACSHKELLEELKKIETWTFGKCELYHWIDILDICDNILEEAVTRHGSNWALACDLPENKNDKNLLLCVLHFTTLLIEHSFSRHLYNSMEHLITLLSSNGMDVVLGVLNLLYMFSKRSNFITRLNNDKRQALVKRLTYLAESWGGKENGFGLAECCENSPLLNFPQSATTLHYEFYTEANPEKQSKPSKSKNSMTLITSIHLDKVDKKNKTPDQLMDEFITLFDVPIDKQMQLFTHLRLAYSFSDYNARLFCVQARLQALSVLVYSNALAENAHSLLYPGLLEELVELLELQQLTIMEIRAAALRTLTSIIHLDRNPHFPKKPGSRLNMIIDVTGAAFYHGLLPALVRTCISSLTTAKDPSNPFPLPLATALFSFLYHLASYEAGGEALVSCGMMESLLRVINWPGQDYEHITFVTRAVRVIDLITNLDMQAFHTHGGLNSFINRLELEVIVCKQDQPFEIDGALPYSLANEDSTSDDERETSQEEASTGSMDLGETSENVQTGSASHIWDQIATERSTNPYTKRNQPVPLKNCLPQRAALLKSMLNFLKKAIQDAAFTEVIRHVMEGSLPASLKHIISNAEYYGPSLFLLATDVVTVYVFQEPSHLSCLQENSLTYVVLHALLVKDVPATREVLGSLPNVFSALCLNSRGLTSFVSFNPFERLFKVLLSPAYLSAMRRRRSSDPMGDTASNLGNAMDELMRHQPSLKTSATMAIIKLLEELVSLGKDPQYVCWRGQNKSEASPTPTPRQTGSNDSSDEEDEEEEETSTSSHPQREETPTESCSVNEKTPIALIDYILNVMKFIDAILSNNSTDDHCREFITLGGLPPLLMILSMPNLPVDYPALSAAQAVATVCKSILTLAREPRVLKEGLKQLNLHLQQLEPLYISERPSGSSVLLHELASAPNLETAFSTWKSTPLLHAMSACHGYVVMFVQVCRTGQGDIRAIAMSTWGSEQGLEVLRNLALLYTALVWETTLLLALCSDDLIPATAASQFGKEDLDKLVPSESKNSENAQFSNTESSSSDMEIDQPTEKKDGKITNPVQIKYIKTLLGASSRLGRALAELFGLLVKLSVGSSIRVRRTQQFPSYPTLPSHPAPAVATELGELLVRGVLWTMLPETSITKFKLTFLICSVGFTTPILFDEKNYPYHLLLQKFVQLGGQSAFFSTFRWALSSGGTLDPNQGLVNPNLPDGTGKFLDAWLVLLEKLVNPKAVLDTPHSISMKHGVLYKTFDPYHYLKHIHKLAFDAVMLLWDKKPLKSYGSRMSESILTILRHILRGEKIIKERLSKEEYPPSENSASGSSGPSNSYSSAQPSSSWQSPPNSTERQCFGINSENLRHLMDMGFTREHCMEALAYTPTMELATLYLLNNPQPSSKSQGTSKSSNRIEDEHLLKAITLSLNDKAMLCSEQECEKHFLTKETIDRFTENSLEVCLRLLDYLPETVFRVTDLLITITKRNGEEWRDNMLRTLIMDIKDKVVHLLELFTKNYDLQTIIHEMLDSALAKQMSARLHLFTLIFEGPMFNELRMPCALAVQKSSILSLIIDLVYKSEEVLRKTKSTPIWLSLVITLIDFQEKAAVCSHRKQKMHNVTNRIWRWLDITTGKWNTYSSSNNKLINEAYWNGENFVRIHSGRRRYTIQFNAMAQNNDENGTSRPITLSLLVRENVEGKEPADKKSDKRDDKSMDTEENNISPDKEKKRNTIISGLENTGPPYLIKALVGFLKMPIDQITLQALLRLCLRLTRNYPIAVDFASKGGIEYMLNLTKECFFPGVIGLATLLIRHVLEEPQTLRFAMEKILRMRSLNNIPPAYKEVMFLLRNTGHAITRDPDAFLEVAKSILRVDLNILSKRNAEEDTRLLVKTISKQTPLDKRLDNTSTKVIDELLNYLIKVIPSDDGIKSSTSGSSKEKLIFLNKNSNTSIQSIPSTSTSASALLTPSGALTLDSSSAPSPSGSDRDPLNLTVTNPVNYYISPRSLMVPVRSNVRNHSPSSESSQESEDKTKNADSKKSSEEWDEEWKRPLLPKSAILKILAEIIRSYPSCTKSIVEHNYFTGQSELVTENCSFLAFLLDKLLPLHENNFDRDCPAMTRMLISAIASCNYSFESQTTLVIEVKSALQRALQLPESSVKHTQIQILSGLISAMIDNCPTTTNGPLSAHVKVQQNLMNNIVKIMWKRGLLMDLARVPHHLDLSNPYTAASINAAMKPLETLSRIINQPTTQNNKMMKNKKSLNENNADEPVGVPTGTTTSEATHAQGEEMVEDTENTEQDISTAGDSIGPNSENARVLDESDFETMDAREVTTNDIEVQTNDMETDSNEMADETDHHHHHSDQNQEQDDDDSDSSDDSETNPNSTPSIEAGNEDEDDDDDEEEDDADDNEDEEDACTAYDEDGLEFFESDEGLPFRIPAFDRENEDILMIQYSDPDPNGPGLVPWNSNNFPLPFGIFEDPSNGNDNSALHLPTPHPFMVSRHEVDGGLPTSRTQHRLYRQRRYQIQINSRNPNPPVILQRILGPSAHDLPEQVSNEIEASFDTRVIVLDSGLGILTNNEEEQINFVDQSGYIFGPSLAATLNNIPTALHWWVEEAKLLDGDSMPDCVTDVLDKLIPHLEKLKNDEICDRKEKRKRQQEEEDTKRRKDSEDKSSIESKKPAPGTAEMAAATENLAESMAESVLRNPSCSTSTSTPTSTNEPSNFTLPANLINTTLPNSPRTSVLSEWELLEISSNMPQPRNIGNNSSGIIIDSNNTRLLSPGLSPIPHFRRNQEESTNDPGPPPPLIPLDQALDMRNAPTNRSYNETNSGIDWTELLDLEAAATWLRSHMEIRNIRQTLAAAVDEPSINEPFESSSNSAITSNVRAATAASNQESSSTNNSTPELPEGVDPSFLSALPEELRAEVIADQLRLQRIRQRAEQQPVETPPTSFSEVNPEFLAALPPNIQEEVLSQHRLERQRRAAATANPNEPVDTAAFFQSMPPSLRQSILTDIEDSQIAALPPELAQEAQTLRREWEARNRQLMQERFFSHVSTSGSALSSILRNSNNSNARSGTTTSSSTQRYTLNSHIPRPHWGTWEPRSTSQPSIGTILQSVNIRLGRFLLDHESLSCLLVILFVDDPKINTGRLHRVIRNFCYHHQTREWVIKTLLSIMERSNESRSDIPSVTAKPRRITTRSQTLGHVEGHSRSSTPSWLNIGMDAALGCRASVFSVIRQTGKRSRSQDNITIHPQAAPTVFRHTLELLISLSKSFPGYFLPKKVNAKKDSFTEMKLRGSNSSSSPNAGRVGSRIESTDFWDMLLKLDTPSTKKGKSGTKSQTIYPITPDGHPKNFESSAFAQLVKMLGSPVVKRSHMLTDKMLRLLSLISIGLPFITYEKNTKTDDSDDTIPLAEQHLKAAIEVITSKTCSEEGLEDATALLMNLSNCPVPSRSLILKLLLNGAMELANMVNVHIGALLEELKEMHRSVPKAKDTDFVVNEKHSKGMVNNRFTKGNVIVTASSKTKAGCDLQLTSMVNLTSKTSSQAFFLRILKVIVQIRDSVRLAHKKNQESQSNPTENVTTPADGPATVSMDVCTNGESSKPQPKKTSSENSESPDSILPTLSEELALDHLWLTLSSSLLELAETPDHHAVLVLQPAVESFFLVHASAAEEHRIASDGREARSNTEQPNRREEPPPEVVMIQPEVIPINPPENEGQSNGPLYLQFNWETQPAPTALTPDQQKFLKFAETHRTVLNQILRQSNTHLADGPFAVLVDHTRVLDFDVKRRYFRTELEQLDEGIRREELAVHVRRSNVFEDSFRELHRRTSDEWKNRFYIVFEGEEGQDAGGLLREWYVIISREIFNPMYALFTTSPGDRVTYMINSSSHCNPNHLCYFKFVGRVIAKAIYDNKLLECYFTRSFYKHILGILVKYTDMESEDYTFFQGLVYLMEHHVSDIGYDLTFSAEVQEFGVTDVRDLIPNGRNIAVCEQNKMDYIRLVCQMKMAGAIKQQINAFLEGFYDIIPKRLISIFNEQELELLISGLPNVDIEDLKANTEYHKYQPSSLQIQWFWRALRSFDQAERAKFLQFVTGTSKVPLQGFGALEGMNGVQKFQIHRDDRSTDRLPSAHTCFNQLDLPVYETYDKLRTNLLKAIHECSEGFGFA